jgi:WD40 repeat protein
MATPGPSESFRDLLLRYRGRSGLTQRQLGDRMGVHRRSVQEWEGGITYPSPERLEGLIRLLLQAHGFTPGHERAEAQAMWAAVQRSAPHTHAPFDGAWFDRLLVPGCAPQEELPRKPREIEAVPLKSAVVERRAAEERRQDWGEAPETAGFIGRNDELQTLSRWVGEERCRLVTLLGMGGIGKTALAARLAQNVAAGFERIYWRSLRDPLPLSEWLAGAIGFLSDQQAVAPTADSERVMALLELLRSRRSLVVLDNFETLFEPGQGEGRIREGLAGYVRLVQAVGDTSHQSCLVLTSREAPPELAMLGGAARSLRLGGMSLDEAQALLAPKQLEGTREQWDDLNARFGGNSLALKVVGESIRELFGGDIGAFLGESGTGSLFGGMRRLLAEQIEGISAAEQRVLRVLAVEREAVTLTPVLATLGPRFDHGALLEAIEALRRRSLIERAEIPDAAAFTLQSVVLEYMTEWLVAAVADEIERGQPELLLEQPLIKAQAKDYVRQSQARVFGEAVLQRLRGRGEGAESRLLGLLDTWRSQPEPAQGYGPGTIVNLLELLRGHLRGLDMSRLSLRQVYLAQVYAQQASLVDAHLTEVALADVFGLPLSVALTSDGALLAAGTSAGELWLWRVADRTPLWSSRVHNGGVWALALSGDGRLLASGGADGTVRLWETGTGRPVGTLRGHTGAVSGVALSADGRMLASGGADGTVRLWGAASGRPLVTLQDHTGAVWSVALSADGRVVASGGEDATVRLWQTETGERLATLRGHRSGVSGVTLSAQGLLLASGGADATVRLWETATGRELAMLEGHTGAVWSVTLSAEGRLLASGSEDGTVRLWDAEGKQLAILQGHTGAVRGVTLSPDSRLLVSGSFDGTVRLWEADTARPVATLQGHTGAVWSVTLSADGRLLASGSEDGAVRLWDAEAGQQLAILQGHTGAVRGVALSADGRLLASGGFDGTVRLWQVATGRQLATLRGHTATVRGVALSADGWLLASASYDGTVRLWHTDTTQSLRILEGHAGGVSGAALSADGRLLAGGGFDGSVRLWETGTGRLLAALQGHTATVRGVVVSGDGRLLASGGEDGTLRLWDTDTGRPLATLEGHAATVRGVALSGDGQLLASGGEDGTLRLWDTASGRPLATLQGHAATVRAVALSSDGLRAASGSFDGTVRLWDVTSGACLHVLQPERRYEGMDITGISGITDAQHSALLALGAVERSSVHSGA